MDQVPQLFKKMLPEQIRLRELITLVGPVKDKTCLQVGPDSPLFSAALRRRGGTWHTLVSNDEAKAALLEVVGDNVETYNGGVMPFEDKTFDIVVISGFMERMEDDAAIIAECHRVTKADSKLILDTRRKKRFSLVNLIEEALGLTAADLGLIRDGYSESEVFELLKQGFDVHSVRSHSRFFIHLVNLVVQGKSKAAARDSTRLLQIYTRAYPFYWIAFQLLDIFVVFPKGYNLVALAKRHAWHARKTPELKDGRPLPDVVLNRISN